MGSVLSLPDSLHAEAGGSFWITITASHAGALASTVQGEPSVQGQAQGVISARRVSDLPP